MHDSYARGMAGKGGKGKGKGQAEGTPLLDLIGATERALAEDGREGRRRYYCQRRECCDDDGFCWVCGEHHPLPTLSTMRRPGT